LRASATIGLNHRYEDGGRQQQTPLAKSRRRADLRRINIEPVFAVHSTAKTNIEQNTFDGASAGTLCREHGGCVMPVADKFGPEADAGFVRAYDARAAGRQCQISIALVLLLALAASALGVLAGLWRR
jgi:hypothetical protein